jgi:hypothetical protein
LLLLLMGVILEYRNGFVVKNNEFFIYHNFEHKSV